MDDPIWIDVEVAIALHERQLAAHGGQAGIRDMGLLDRRLIALGNCLRIPIRRRR